MPERRRRRPHPRVTARRRRNDTRQEFLPAVLLKRVQPCCGLHDSEPGSKKAEAIGTSSALWRRDHNGSDGRATAVSVMFGSLRMPESVTRDTEKSSSISVRIFYS